MTRGSSTGSTASRSSACATTRRRTRAARPAWTATSSAPARCRPRPASPPGRWRTSSTGPPRWRSRRSGSSSSSPRDAALDHPPGEPPAAAARRRDGRHGGAGLLPCPQTIDDLVNFVVARCLDQLGNRPDARQPVGAVSSGTLAPAAVEAMFDRISPVYDPMNRLMTAGLDRRWRRLDGARRSSGPATACSMPAAARATSRWRPSGPAAASPGSTSPSGCSSAHAASRPRSSGCAATCSRSRSPTELRRGHGRLRHPQRRGPRGRPRRAGPRASAGGRLGCLEITRPRGALRPFFALWFDGLVPLAGRCFRAGRLHVPAGERAPLPGPEELGEAIATRRLRPDRLAPARRRDRRPPRRDQERERARDRPRRPGARRLPRAARGAPRALGRLAPGLVGEIGADTLAAGGKRLRPVLVFLCTPPDDRTGERAVAGGASVELVHMATLVHDDLLDGADLRRGRPTAWAEHGDGAAKATGDYLFARAFAELAGTGDARGRRRPGRGRARARPRRGAPAAPGLPARTRPSTTTSRAAR